MCRYVERNPLRAGHVSRAERWPWSSLGSGARAPALWTPWPVPRPEDWKAWVDRVQSAAELAALQAAVARGSPLGDEAWVQATARQLGLGATLRPRG